MGTSGDHQGAHSLSDREIECRLVELHVSDAARAAERYSLLTEADRRGIGKAHGYSSVAQWYSKNTRCTEGSVQHLVDLGAWLREHPTVADALAASDIHAGHTRALHDAYCTIAVADPAQDEGTLRIHLATLLEVALHTTPGGVTHRARALVARAVADAQARHDDEQRRRAEEERLREEQRLQEEEQLRRERAASGGTPVPDDESESDSAGGAGVVPAALAGPRSGPGLGTGPGPMSGSGSGLGSGSGSGLGPRPVSAAENPALNTLKIFELADGRWRIEGNLDVFTIGKMRTALDPLTRPQPEADGTHDQRSPAKRAADGLGVIVDHHLYRRPGPGGGSSARVNLVVRLQDLDTAGCPHPSNRGAGEHGWPLDLEWAGPVSESLAELITCDADLGVVVVDGAGVPLAMGTEVRLATDEQRIAVKIRDRCCVMCGRPASWCQVHHIVYASDGGPTDLNNLALVCGRCHRLVHYDGWQLLMGQDGHPYAIPPAVTDPYRTPIPSYHRRRKPHT